MGHSVIAQFFAETVDQTIKITSRAIVLVQSIWLPNEKPRGRPYWHKCLESLIMISG